MKAKKYQMGGPVDPRKKYSKMPMTPTEQMEFDKMKDMRRAMAKSKVKDAVGGEAQRTQAEAMAFEERRIEGMRESLREGEGIKSLQAYDKELTAKGYSFPNGSSNIKTIMKAKKFDKGGKVGRRRAEVKKMSAGYEENREKFRKEAEERAKTIQYQRAYNSAARADGMGEYGRGRRIRENATSKGINVSSAQSSGMGVTGPGVDLNKSIQRRPKGTSITVSSSAARPTRVSDSVRDDALSRKLGEALMAENKKKGIKLQFGGKIKKMK
jgi:hypothetical protein